jgi:hypothetical protein
MPWNYLKTISDTLDQSLQQSQSIFRKLSDGVLNLHSLGVLLVCLIAAVLAGRLIAKSLQGITVGLARQADRSKSLQRVNQLRRTETLIVLSIAVIRALLLALALYFWWNYSYPYHNISSTVGAGVIFAVIAGYSFGPVLQDIAAGTLMMTEQWFGVGDHIRVEPFMDVQGVVERVTLRSTRIRGLNGEVIWMNNKAIQAVRITPRGIRTIALELFVSNIDRGLELVEQTDLQLPKSSLTLVSPLTVMTSNDLGNGTWQITAIGETAPGREWILEKQAIDIIADLDKKKRGASILLSAPIARYADSETERKFARTIQNARKQPAQRRRLHRKNN